MADFIRECQNQVKYQGASNPFFFCLVMKEYLSDCPLKCPYFIQGSAIPMNQIYEHNYEMECPYFHLLVTISEQDETWFVCGKTGEEPEPQNCK